jgi:hypothetical protein
MKVAQILGIVQKSCDMKDKEREEQGLKEITLIRSNLPGNEVDDIDELIIEFEKR